MLKLNKGDLLRIRRLDCNFPFLHPLDVMEVIGNDAKHNNCLSIVIHPCNRTALMRDASFKEDLFCKIEVETNEF